MKKLLLTISAMVAVMASYAQISGPTSACSGNPVSFTDSAFLSSGTWSSSNPSVATVDATTGMGYAVGVGSTVISHVTGSGTFTHPFTVFATPAPIVASSTTMCTGETITLTDPTPGGSWATSTSWIAVLNPAGGLTAWNPGTAVVEYVSPDGCSTSITITVSGTSPGEIMVPATICLGSPVTVVDSVAGGTWSSSSSAVASISSSGTYTADLIGLAVGTVTISYTVPSSCGSGTATATATTTIINTTDAGTIYGGTTVTAGSSLYLSETTTGGTWSISPSSVATIDAYGTVTGLTAGTAVVTYTVSGCGGTASAVYTVTVTPYDGIAGTVHFTGAAYYGAVKVWLITYSAPNLAAIDSAYIYASGSSAAYHFDGVPTNTYRVKAAIPEDSAGLVGSTGYIPTYHTSSFYWSTADVINHTSGTGDVGEDINMMTGTISSGPGFIAGDVTTGANKGTTTSAPVSGLKMYVFNSSNVLYQTVRTNSAGHYSFSNLPTGTYYIFPDSLNYATTPYASINITSGSPSFSSASFIQHTLSHTITPIGVGVNEVAAEASVMAFPNPTNGKLFLAWKLPVTQDATISVCDVTGREVYNSNVHMTEGASSTQLNLSYLNSGLYTISVKADALNYVSKIQVQH